MHRRHLIALAAATSEGGAMLAGFDTAKLRPIPVNQELLGYLDQTKRLRFLRDWQRALQGK